MKAFLLKLLPKAAPPPPPLLGYRRLKQILEELSNRGRVLDLGSGKRRVGEGIINVDVVWHPSVDLMGDGHNLPFVDECFDLVICTSVLEHMDDHRRGIEEIQRVLRKGGSVFFEVPFLYPFHADDPEQEKDYLRLSLPGLRRALGCFEELESGVSLGPGSTLSVIIPEFTALFFSGRHTALYYTIRNLTSWLMIPLRWLDRFLAHKRFAERIGGCFYYYGRKR